MVLYLLLCLISVLAGCGILTLIGVDVDRRNTLFLAPVITLSSLTIFMGGLVAGGFTVGEITPAAYVLCLGVAVLGAFRQGKTVLAGWRALLILAGLPLLILLPAIVQGIENYSGGLCLDGWSYVTFGQALQHYPLDSGGWFPINVQYGAAFGRAIRFISPAFLALLAPLSGAHNDAQEVLGHYLGWLFFVYGSACLFFAKAARLSRSMAWVLVILSMLSGWMLKIINANSVDNALALSLLPAAFGVLMLMPAPSVRDGIILGAIMATILYGYPEYSPFIITAILAMAAQRMIAAPQQLREFKRMGVAFVVMSGLCILPYAAEIGAFFQRQVRLSRGVVGARPGEFFYQLLSTTGYVLQGYWGLTPDFVFQRNPETYLHHYNLFASAAACILTIAALAGMFLLLRQRKWSVPLFAAGMTAAYAIALVHFQYPYAAYKLLLITWVLLSYGVVVAVEWIWENSRRRRLEWLHYACAAVGFLLLVAIMGSFFMQERIFYDSLPFKSLRDFKKISVAENLAGKSPLAMIVKETYANLWGLHFLRHTKLYVGGEYRGYMAGYPALMDQSEPVDFSEIHFVVTDDERSMDSKRLLSKLGPYYVWDCRRGPWALLTEVNNPNGLETGPAGPFIWLGKGDTELRILSPVATSAVISAKFTLGPSLPGRPRQHLLVKIGDFEEELEIGSGEYSVSVPLQPGLNHVILRPLDKPAMFLPNDPRPLLINASQISVRTPQSNETAYIREIENPDGLESWLGREPFFWMNGRDTMVEIAASAAGIAQLTTTLVPGPSLVDKSRARFSIIPPTGAKIQKELNWGPAQIDVPVQAGLNRIVMRAVGRSGPNITARRDPRVMMIGFRNLEASYRTISGDGNCGDRVNCQ